MHTKLLRTVDLLSPLIKFPPDVDAIVKNLQPDFATAADTDEDILKAQLKMNLVCN